MVFLTALTTLMRKTAKPGLRACATQMSFSANQMVCASRGTGSVTGTQTVSMDLMSTMAACPRPVPHLSSIVTMDTVSTESGSAMETMTAET